VELDTHRSLLTHMEWADTVTWQTALATPGAERDPRVLDLSYHLQVVQLVYLQMWRTLAPAPPERRRFETLSSIVEWARTCYVDLHAFLADADPAHLALEITVPWAGEIVKHFGAYRPATLAETMLQVVLHSTYHRAQIATRLRELGATPQVTDYIAWIWQGQPAPDWREEASA
jgi:uncharacterized damage-inducible protein DinB